MTSESNEANNSEQIFRLGDIVLVTARRDNIAPGGWAGLNKSSPKYLRSEVAYKQDAHRRPIGEIKRTHFIRAKDFDVVEF
jgi:hypothetical protein